jgi:hypothetical protein
MISMTTRAKTTLTWTSSFPMMKVMIGIESLSLSLKIMIKNKFLGFAYLIKLQFREIVNEVHLLWLWCICVIWIFD